MRNIIRGLSFIVIIVCFAGCTHGTDNFATLGEMPTPTTREVAKSTEEMTEAPTTTILDEPIDKTIYANKAGVRYEYVPQSSCNMSITEEGVILLENRNVYIKQVDSGKKELLCNNPECMHLRLLNCPAVVSESKCAFYEGILYCFETVRKSDGGGYNIYTQRIDNGKKEFLVNVPCSLDFQCIIFSGDYMYCIDRLPVEATASEKANTLYKIVEIDLIDGQYRFITEPNTSSHFELADGKIYYYKDFASGDESYVVQKDIYTLEEKIVLSNEEDLNRYEYKGAYDEDSYFYYDVLNKEIGIR